MGPRCWRSAGLLDLVRRATTAPETQAPTTERDKYEASVTALLCICTLLAAAAQATSFTAANSTRDPAYYPNGYADPLTVTVEPGSEDAVITVPEATFSGYPWPPPVAVLFYSAGAWYADCNHRALGAGARTDDAGVQWWGGELLGYCMGELAVTMLGNGRAEIRVPKEWFLEAAKLVYGIYKRYETCLATGGETDIWFGGRCPPLGSGRGNRNEVARPWTGLRIQLQWDSSGNANAEYFFYMCTSWNVHDPRHRTIGVGILTPVIPTASWKKSTPGSKARKNQPIDVS